MKHHRQNADAGPQEPQLTPEDEVALEWLVSNRPEPKSVEGLLHWLFLLSRAARPNDDANVDDLANASIKIRRSTTDERLRWSRSEEHTSELQSPCNLVCRLLLEKKKKEA